MRYFNAYNNTVSKQIRFLQRSWLPELPARWRQTQHTHTSVALPTQLCTYRLSPCSITPLQLEGRATSPSRQMRQNRLTDYD